MHYCGYHKIEHEDEEFGKRSNGSLNSWCKKAKAEDHQNKKNGLGSQSKSQGDRSRSGRPKWYTDEDLVKIKEMIADGMSYSAIGREFSNRQASQIHLIAKREGAEFVSQDAKKFANPDAP